MNNQPKVQAPAQASGSQMRFDADELALFQATFKGNEKLLKLLRKVFLPELDPKAPLGQMIDLWMTVKIEGLPMEEQLVNLKARNILITHVDQMINSIKILSEMEVPNQAAAIAKVKANSAK